MAATECTSSASGVGGASPLTPASGVVLVPPDEGVTASVPPASGLAGALGGDAAVEVAGSADPASPEGPPDWWARVRGSLSAARSLWRDFTGESAYDHYVERHRREHPDHEPMGEREFWRERARFDEDNVSTGCC